MSNKSGEHDLQQEIATKRPTVEELLKMLTGNTSPSDRPSAPPVPPKPKTGFEMSIEAAKRSLGLLPEPKKWANSTTSDSTSKGNNKSANRTFLVNSGGGDEFDSTRDSGAFKVTSDPFREHDTGTVSGSRPTSPTSRLGYYENNHPPAPPKSVTKITSSVRAAAAATTTTTTNPSHGGSIVYISSPTPSNTFPGEHEKPSPAVGSIISGYQDGHQNRLTHRSKPIVTELSDETNNNKRVERAPLGQLNRSTVEILELPGNGDRRSQSRDFHGYTSTITGSNKQEQTASAGEQQRSAYPQRVHRNGASAFAASNLVVVSATDSYGEHDNGNDDDDDDDDVVDGSDDAVDDAQLAKEVETILSDSLMADANQPPRTSTPTPTAELKQRRYQASSGTDSSSGASTATNNNNLSSQNAYASQTSSSRIANSNLPQSDIISETDTLNISRETDELTNTSVHNQSGCELVGVNDNSDSPRKIEQVHATSQQDLTTPYTVQFFNDTLLSPSGSSSSPPEHSSASGAGRVGGGAHDKSNIGTSRKWSTEALDKRVSSRAHEMSIHELESNNLRKLVTTLQEQIEKLNDKVSGLTSKVEDLESELDRQKRDNGATLLSGSKSAASIFAASQEPRVTSRQDSSFHQSPAGTMQKLSPLSQSVSTINKLTPTIKSSRLNGSGLMSTYSRDGGSGSSGNGTSQQPSHSSGLLSSAKRLQNQSHNTSISRQAQTRKHTSTSSLYAESNKSGNASISPTPLDASAPSSATINNRASGGGAGGRITSDCASPLSYLTQKRDPAALNSSTYTSMLSLSSMGNSTLRAPGSMAGSVSNLSQFGTLTTVSSQLSNWPSMSNFITSKHQAKDILYDEEEQIIRMVLYNTLITMRVPSWLRSSYCLDHMVEAPAVRLKLDWVHGYRGRDCRSNIYYLPTGECIYFVASIVILYNPEERTQRHYLGHTDSVKCIAVHPNKLIVASGQSAIAHRRDKRPIVRVWNTVSLATLRVIGFNEDFDRSICCLAFSKHDAGATLAVVDESSEHTITLLDWQREKNWRVAEANSGHEPVLAIDFHPIDKYSLVAVGKSSINFWDVRGMTLAKKAGLFDKYDRPKYVLCMTFNDLGETITGDSNGNIIIWPRGNNKPRSIKRDVHPGGVFSVLAMKDGSYLTGGRDRRVVEWDDQFEPTGRQIELPEHCGGVRFITCARGAQVIIGTLRNSILIGSLDTSFQIIVQGHTEATTALAIHPILPKYLTGGFDDQIQMMDAKTHSLEWSKCLATPITGASFSPNGNILILGSTSGSWLALDVITQEVLFTACDGTGTIDCVKFSPNGELFAMGSSDCNLYIYQTTPSGNTFYRLGTCVGHSGPVKEIDWSDDSSYLQSQSMNFELLFWKAHNCRPVDNEDIVHDLKWTTHNCTIGFNVIGIWSDSIDSALINYCDKSNNDKYIVSATDTGFLNIYKWPTYYNQCSSQKYYGNVDRFDFTKFLPDNTKLIAVGTKSCATTEWSVFEENDD